MNRTTQKRYKSKTANVRLRFMFHYDIPQKDGAQIPAWLALRISTTPPPAGEKLRRKTNLRDCQTQRRHAPGVSDIGRNWQSD